MLTISQKNDCLVHFLTKIPKNCPNLLNSVLCHLKFSIVIVVLGAIISNDVVIIIIVNIVKIIISIVIIITIII